MNGCNPKKVLVRSTEVLEEIRRAHEYGIEVGEVRTKWSSVIDRKESFTSGVTSSTNQSLKEQGVDLIQGSPRFVSDDELEVNGERIRAGAVLIATGSTPRPIEFEGARLLKISNDILALRTVPDRLVIVGAGVVAFEFGQVFARLGSRVTMLTPGERGLSGHDEDLVDSVVQFSNGLGIELITKVRLNAVREQAGALAVEFQSGGEARTIPADFVLNAAGRIPSIVDLALDKAGVQVDRRGVVVNEFLRSPTNQRVFAAGDAHGPMRLSPVASYEGRVAATNFLEGDEY